jgi:hypothetical protein
MDEENQGTVEDDRNGGSRTPIRVLLLDDREDNLIVRSRPKRSSTISTSRCSITTLDRESLAPK